MSTPDRITHTDIKEALESEGFKIDGEDTGGGCFVGYATKGEGQRITFGPFMWEDERYVVEPGDFYIGPDTMDEETGDILDPEPELITAKVGCTLEDIVNIVISEDVKLNG